LCNKHGERGGCPGDLRNRDMRGKRTNFDAKEMIVYLENFHVTRLDATHD